MPFKLGVLETHCVDAVDAVEAVSAVQTEPQSPHAFSRSAGGAEQIEMHMSTKRPRSSHPKQHDDGSSGAGSFCVGGLATCGPVFRNKLQAPAI